MEPSAITCASRIERVVVYARGAVVTRRIDLTAALPAGACDLAVPGITARAEAGSLRVLAEGGAAREVVGVRARLVLPPAPAQPEGIAGRLRELDLEEARITAEAGHLRWRRDTLGAVWLDPELVRRARRIDPAARIGDALAVSGLLSAEIEALDARIAALDHELERVARAREAAGIEAAQATSAELHGDAAPTYEAIVRLAPAGDAQVEEAPALRLEYAVLAARWWPAYAARFSRGATRVAWSLDAFVAQATGEDWEGVRLALSTADLVQDARLPELASLRLGRAQPAPRRG
ncbi:MAG: DUF4139 domain-containing protein, partial [Polyangiaceae bacterium]|nr:DUF4139 domain-containing protein [Polyangiaceae bacterium]